MSSSRLPSSLGIYFLCDLRIIFYFLWGSSFLCLSSIVSRRLELRESVIKCIPHDANLVLFQDTRCHVVRIDKTRQVYYYYSSPPASFWTGITQISGNVREIDVIRPSQCIQKQKCFQLPSKKEQGQRQRQN